MNPKNAWHVLCVALMLFGSWYSGRYAYRNLQEFHLLKTYMPHPGVLKQLQIIEVNGPKRARYCPQVSFQYTINGNTYDSNDWSNAASVPRYAPREYAEEEFRSLTAGQQITVHVNPADPTKAILYLPTKVDLWFWVTMSGLLGVLGILGAVETARTWSTKPVQERWAHD